MTIDMENYEKKEVIKNFESSEKDVVKCSQHGKLHGFVHFSKKQLNEKRTVTLSGWVHFKFCSYNMQHLLLTKIQLFSDTYILIL